MPMAPHAPIPITSCAPRFADRNASPAIQAGIFRPEVRKSDPVWICLRNIQPMPSTKMKYTARIR